MIENPKSFEDYYQNYHLAMVDRASRAISYCADRAEAEEVVQEMWVTAAEIWDRIEDESKRGAWIMGVLNYKIRHHLRSRSRAGRSWTVNLNTLEEMEAINSYAEGEDLIWEAIEAAEEFDHRMRELDLHNAGYYEAVYFRRVSGMSLHEISERTGLPIGTVRSRLSRGLKFIGADTQYGKAHKRRTSEEPVFACPSVKDSHPWYEAEGVAPGREYHQRQTQTRPNHYELGGVPKQPNCPGYRQCPVCAHFPSRDHQ